MQVSCFLLLGSNIADKSKTLYKAVDIINTEIGTVKTQSNVYESEAWGYKDPETYHNLALEILTELTSTELLNTCLNIEKLLGRRRTASQYEARTIDIDVVFYGNDIINTESLIVPHPRMQDRKFVLEPLNEIASSLLHPVLNKTIHQLLETCTDTLWVKKL